MLESIVSLIATATICVTAYGAGRPIFRALIRGQHDAFEETVWSVSIGLVACGTLIAWLGLLERKCRAAASSAWRAALGSSSLRRGRPAGAMGGFLAVINRSINICGRLINRSIK